MNFDLTYITVPIGSAGIGYITNWLAIKMLFRPHKEVRIAGLKLPFTPGLIPKERKRIAASIGEVVGRYLLTGDRVVEELTSQQMKEGIEVFVNRELFDQSYEIKLDRILNKFEGRIEVNAIVDVLNNKILRLIEEKDFVDSFSKEIASYLIQCLGQIELSNQGQVIDQIVDAIVGGSYVKEQLEEILLGAFNNNVIIEELLGEKITQFIDGAIKYNEPKIKLAIQDLMEKEEVKVQVTKMISDVIMSKVGALGAMFVNPESIYQSAVESIKEKLEETEISSYIIDYIQGVYKYQLYELMPEHVRVNLVKELSERILSGNIIDHLKSSLKASDKSVLEMVNIVTNDESLHYIEEFIARFLLKIIDNRDQLDKIIKSGLEKVMESFIKTPILISEEKKVGILEEICARYDKIVKNYIPKIVKDSKIIELVERQINSFDIEMLEEIILSIAKKELRAITWLGAVLGFIMSFVILAFR